MSPICHHELFDINQLNFSFFTTAIFLSAVFLLLQQSEGWV